MPYEYPKFEYRRSPDQDTADPVRHPVVIIGAGPVGLDLTIDPAFKQVSVVLLEALDTISVGSRAICFAKRTLEVCERIGLQLLKPDLGSSLDLLASARNRVEDYSARNIS